jgi:hypothetical protein
VKTRIQFPIQLAGTCIIHCAQGLIFNFLSFDSTHMMKHGLTYTNLFRFHCYKTIYFLILLILIINSIVEEKMI